MGDDCIVEAVNRRRKLAITGNGERLPIVKWLDEDGDDCQPDGAVVCIAEYGEKYLTIDLRDFYMFAGN